MSVRVCARTPTYMHTRRMPCSGWVRGSGMDSVKLFPQHTTALQSPATNSTRPRHARSSSPNTAANVESPAATSRSASRSVAVAVARATFASHAAMTAAREVREAVLTCARDRISRFVFESATWRRGTGEQHQQRRTRMPPGQQRRTCRSAAAPSSPIGLHSSESARSCVCPCSAIAIPSAPVSLNSLPSSRTCVTLRESKSNQFTSNAINQIKSIHIKSNQINSNQIKSNQIHSLASTTHTPARRGERVSDRRRAAVPQTVAAEAKRDERSAHGEAARERARALAQLHSG